MPHTYKVFSPSGERRLYVLRGGWWPHVATWLPERGWRRA